MGVCIYINASICLAGRINKFWIIILLFTFPVFELLQFVKIINGTADFNDIICYCTFSAVAFIIHKLIFKTINHEQNFEHVLSLLAVLMFVYIGIESAPSKKSLTTESDQIPPGIKDYNETTLIVKSRNDWTKYAEKYFDEYYTGKHIFIDETDQSSSQYSDY
jgi:hypothetical protein